MKRPHSAACEKMCTPMSPKTEKKCWGQSLCAIMDIESPQTIRVCHMFRFSKNLKHWKILISWVIRDKVTKQKMLQVSNVGQKHQRPVPKHR